MASFLYVGEDPGYTTNVAPIFFDSSVEQNKYISKTYLLATKYCSLMLALKMSC